MQASKPSKICHLRKRQNAKIVNLLQRRRIQAVDRIGGAHKNVKRANKLSIVMLARNVDNVVDYGYSTAQ